MKHMFIFILACSPAFGYNWGAYNGPRDVRIVDEDSRDPMYDTSMGQLVKLSTAAGIGQVIEKGQLETPVFSYVDYFKVRVTQPLFGCTNNQIFKVMEEKEKTGGTSGGWGGDDAHGNRVYEEPIRFDAYPTNHSQIVFALTTNVYISAGLAVRRWDYFDKARQFTPYRTRELPFLNETTRSWWYTDDQNGLPMAYFTNVVRTMRTQRNWTNYYEVCRDGASSPSPRVQEDSFWDMRFMIYRLPDEKLLYMKNDPLFPTNNYSYLLRFIRPEDK